VTGRREAWLFWTPPGVGRPDRRHGTPRRAAIRLHLGPNFRRAVFHGDRSPPGLAGRMARAAYQGAATGRGCLLVRAGGGRRRRHSVRLHFRLGHRSRNTPPGPIVPRAAALDARTDGRALGALLAGAALVIPTPAPVQAPVDPELPREPRPLHDQTDGRHGARPCEGPPPHPAVVSYRISSGPISIRSFGETPVVTYPTSAVRTPPPDDRTSTW
jgi:hypothetical protein